MKYFDYIVFDVDGTLADTEESVLSSLGQIVQEETGKTLPRHELEFALGIPGKDALEKLGDRKSTRLNSSHKTESRMPSSA